MIKPCCYLALCGTHAEGANVDKAMQIAHAETQQLFSLVIPITAITASDQAHA